MNLAAIHQLSRLSAFLSMSVYLSPYILCLFRLGLAPGVLSLLRPASSKFFRALLKAPASTGSDPALSMPLVLCPFTDRLPVPVGGVLDSGGETSDGNWFFSMVREVIEVWVVSIVVSRMVVRKRT